MFSCGSLCSKLADHNQTTYSTLAALYAAGTSLGSQGAKFVIVTSDVTNALTNNNVGGASRGIVSQADNTTIDMLMFSIASSKIYMCRMTSATTVTGLRVI